MLFLSASSVSMMSLSLSPIKTRVRDLSFRRILSTQLSNAEVSYQSDSLSLWCLSLSLYHGDFMVPLCSCKGERRQMDEADPAVPGTRCRVL